MPMNPPPLSSLPPARRVLARTASTLDLAPRHRSATPAHLGPGRSLSPDPRPPGSGRDGGPGCVLRSHDGLGRVPRRAGSSTAPTRKGAAPTSIPTRPPRAGDRLRGRADGRAGRRARRRRRVFAQGQWDKLLQVLDTGRIDLVVNGYEWTEDRAPRLPGDPAVLRLPAPAHGPPRRPGPVAGPTCKRPQPGGGRWRSASWPARPPTPSRASRAAPNVEVVPFDGATDAMTAVAERPDRRHAPGPPRRAASIATGSRAWSWPVRPVGTAIT